MNATTPSIANRQKSAPKSTGEMAQGGAPRTVPTLPRSAWVYAAIPLVIVVAGAAAAHEFITFAFRSNLALNGLILGVFLLGVGMILARLFHVAREARVFDWKLGLFVGTERRAMPAALEKTEVAEMFRRLETHGLAPGQYVPAGAIESEVEALEQAIERRYEFAQFLVGGMVALGLLGTFVGLLETLIRTSELIGGIADGAAGGGGNIEDEFRGIVRDLKAPLEAMGTAFSASMFGLVGSIMLGLELVSVRSAATKLIEGVRSGLLRVAAGDKQEESVGTVEVSEAYLAGFIAYLKRHHEESRTVLGALVATSTQLAPVVEAMREDVAKLDLRLAALERVGEGVGGRLGQVSSEMKALAAKVVTQAAATEGLTASVAVQQQSLAVLEPLVGRFDEMQDFLRRDQALARELVDGVSRLTHIVEQQSRAQSAVSQDQLTSLRSIAALQSRALQSTSELDMGLSQIAAGVGAIAEHLADRDS